MVLDYKRVVFHLVVVGLLLPQVERFMYLRVLQGKGAVRDEWTVFDLLVALKSYPYSGEQHCNTP